MNTVITTKVSFADSLPNEPRSTEDLAMKKEASDCDILRRRSLRTIFIESSEHSRAKHNYTRMTPQHPNISQRPS